jgi:hypothetical protein
MNNYLKTSKWLRWIAAGTFGVMLTLNIMISLEFEKDRVLPSLTLVELGNRAMAQSEDDGHARICDRIWKVFIKPDGTHCETGGTYKCGYCTE